MALYYNGYIDSLYLGSSKVIGVYKGSTMIYPAAGTTYDFSYTGNVQEVTLPQGQYKLQCWGAQGGSVTGTYAVSGSKGGYSEGIITLTETTTFYVFVGGQGTSYTSSSSQTSTTVVNGGWNGGGAGVRTARYYSGDTDGRSFPRGGGGGTDIALISSSMNYSDGVTVRDAASLLSRIIVAGGGAGASSRYSVVTTTDEFITSENRSETFYGDAYSPSENITYGSIYGVLTSASGSVTFTNTGTVSIRLIIYNSGSEQERISLDLGVSTTLSSYNSSNGWVQFVSRMEGDFTDGSMACRADWTIETVDTQTNTSTSSGKSSGAQQGGGKTGGGQYSGSQTSAGNGGLFGIGASQTSTNYRYCAGGGGGGWYGGGTSKSDYSTDYVSYSGGGSGFVNTAANTSSRPSGYTGLQLDSGTTTAGSSSFESVSGGAETGHSGNGYARITVIE